MNSSLPQATARAVSMPTVPTSDSQLTCSRCLACDREWQAQKGDRLRQLGMGSN